MSEIPENLRETQKVGGGTVELIVPAATCTDFRRHGIGGVGISRAVSGFRWVRFDPSISVVMVCFGGEGRVFVGGGWERCSEGTAYITPVRSLHAYHAVPGVAWDLCWVVYEAWADPAPTFMLSAPVLIQADSASLPRLVQGLYGEYLGKGEATAMHHWAELVHLEVGRITQAWHPDNRLSRLWEAVNAALDQPWTVASMAERTGVSGEQLRSLCQKHMGRSPGKQLTYLRMQRASYLLKTTNWTVEAVAQAVGYENAFAFSTAFKRWAGRAPSQFRTYADPPEAAPLPNHLADH